MLEKISQWIVYDLLNLSSESLLAEAADFFIADIIKIFLLLAVVIFIVSIIRTFLPPGKIKNILSRKQKYVGNILASVLGIFTPFCTCSAIPLFLGFIEAGVPLGVTFSFLVASPMINEIALALLWSVFGLKIALVYVLSGLFIAVISGIIIGKLNIERLLNEEVFNNYGRNNTLGMELETWKGRFGYAKDYTIAIIRKVWIYIILGVGLGAFIHGWAPVGFLEQYIGKDAWYAIPLAVLVGIPLYSNAAGIIPLVSALVEKGAGIGTALAFMMSVIGLSLPEFMILKKVMKLKLIAIFVIIVGFGIIFTGYLFNAIL